MVTVHYQTSVEGKLDKKKTKRMSGEESPSSMKHSLSGILKFLCVCICRCIGRSLFASILTIKMAEAN